MNQKVLKVGTSAAVTIPKASLKELGLKIGDKVFVNINHSESAIVFSKKPIQNISFISKRDTEIMRWTKNFIEKYRKDLESLAKK